MDYDEAKIRQQVIAGLRVEPRRIELEEIDYGAKLGVFYRSGDGIKRVSCETKGKTDDQIAFALLSKLMNEDRRQKFAVAAPGANLKIQLPQSPYEGRRGKHPRSCTCSKHKAVDGAQAA